MKNVLLVFGGVSYEHDSSIVTAFQIFKKTKINGVKLNLFYVSRDGKFYLCDERKINILDFSKNSFSARKKGFKEIVFVSGENNKLFVKTRFGLKEYISADVAIFACHGGDGENGKLVTLFESVNICCSAGRSESLSICMDKFLFKNFAKGINIPVVPGFKLNQRDLLNDKKAIINKLLRLGFPVILKINNGGSSIGIFVANNFDEFLSGAKSLFEFGDDVIVEKFIPKNREFNVAVIGDSSKFEISEIDEPIKQNEILSFADKYMSSDSVKGVKQKGTMSFNLRKDVNLSDKNKEKIKSIARKIFLNLGLFGVVRIDFLYDEQNDKIYVCEVNAIPGSLAYYFFKKNTIVTNDLIEKLIFIAQENYKKELINNKLVVDILSEK
jgi:D-alanine-D-alanine ligase